MWTLVMETLRALGDGSILRAWRDRTESRPFLPATVRCPYTDPHGRLPFVRLGERAGREILFGLRNLARPGLSPLRRRPADGRPVLPVVRAGAGTRGGRRGAEAGHRAVRRRHGVDRTRRAARRRAPPRGHGRVLLRHAGGDRSRGRDGGEVHRG